MKLGRRFALSMVAAAAIASAGVALIGCGGGPDLSSIGTSMGNGANTILTSFQGGGGGGNNTVRMAANAFTTAQDAWKALSLTPAQEDAFGQSTAAELLTANPAVGDQKLSQYVSMVGLTVASASPNPGGNYIFGVLDRPDVNAFSGPNGYIFVTKGAVAQMQDEAELAGVLGHEISHVCTHDGLHQLQADAQRGVLVDALKIDNRTQLFAAVTNQGIDVITKTGYTQPQENDADTGSVKILAAAGYDPHSYLHFLQRLQALQGSGSGLRIMSTHPGLGDRLKNVQAAIDSLHASGGATLADRFNQNVILH